MSHSTVGLPRESMIGRAVTAEIVCTPRLAPARTALEAARTADDNMMYSLHMFQSGADAAGCEMHVPIRHRKSLAKCLTKRVVQK